MISNLKNTIIQNCVRFQKGNDGKHLPEHFQLEPRLSYLHNLSRKQQEKFFLIISTTQIVELQSLEVSENWLYNIINMAHLHCSSRPKIPFAYLIRLPSRPRFAQTPVFLQLSYHASHFCDTKLSPKRRKATDLQTTLPPNFPALTMQRIKNVAE